MDFKDIKSIKGDITVPGDKSISHRSAIISALADDPVNIENYLFSRDCISTLDVLKELGVKIIEDGKKLSVNGRGISGLSEPSKILEVDNSGTTIRLLSGVLAGNSFMSVLSGDSSINSRPMRRIIEPLTAMGACVRGRQNNTKAPIIIFGKKDLTGRKFDLDLSSAQVKSCILLAALHAKGKTEINQPEISRDHSERMLEYFDADISYNGKNTKIDPDRKLRAKDLIIPGDLSSALFIIVAALLLKNSNILIRDVGINQTRSYILDILKEMGGRINIKNRRVVCNEPVADIEVSSSKLMPAKIGIDKIPNIIDEIPILAVAAAVADGTTIIKGAGELRNKESDRLKAIRTRFNKAGLNIKELKDGLEIRGNNKLKVRGGIIDSMDDHRIAMSLAVLSMLSEEKLIVTNLECIDTSFPGFKNTINSIAN
ncbi:MAG TPA: 3-phosphoshikimate 1-carboxyvinyltransferase [Actinobacteria bacterium]|nr:3-phosphoshikimate 1-carboxyvinyltransferase [Actinomycetota bacterium]